MKKPIFYNYSNLNTSISSFPSLMMINILLVPISLCYASSRCPVVSLWCFYFYFLRLSVHAGRHQPMLALTPARPHALRQTHSHNTRLFTAASLQSRKAVVIFLQAAHTGREARFRSLACVEQRWKIGAVRAVQQQPKESTLLDILTHICQFFGGSYLIVKPVVRLWILIF